jgi:multidrug efflux system outer membrane protein
MSRRARTSPLAFAAVVSALWLPACMVGPKYQRPQVPEPPAHRFAEGAPGEASLADAPWWDVMKDPVLQALVREAIASNLDLRTATARVAEARAQYGIAKSYLFPQVGISAGYDAQQRSRLSEPPQASSLKKTYQNYSGAIGASWEIDLFGRLRSEKNAAFASYLATEQGRRAALVTLVGDVASTYLLIRELDLQLEVARRTVAANEETVSFYTKRLTGGVSNRLEVDRA